MSHTRKIIYTSYSNTERKTQTRYLFTYLLLVLFSNHRPSSRGTTKKTDLRLAYNKFRIFFIFFFPFFNTWLPCNVGIWQTLETSRKYLKLLYGNDTNSVTLVTSINLTVVKYKEEIHKWTYYVLNNKRFMCRHFPETNRTKENYPLNKQKWRHTIIEITLK